MDVVALKHAAFDVRRVGGPGTQPLYCRFLVAERLKELEREVGRVERLFRQLGNGFFDFNGVHLPTASCGRAAIVRFVVMSL